MTNNFNLTELMEKRVRSRFSQKTMFITIKSYEDIIISLQIMFGVDTNNMNLSGKDIENNKLLRDFFQVLIRNEHFINFIMNQINKGFSVKQILTKIKLVLANLLFEVVNTNKQQKLISYEAIQEVLKGNLKAIKEEDYYGSYALLLKSKLFIIVT